MASFTNILFIVEVFLMKKNLLYFLVLFNFIFFKGISQAQNNDLVVMLHQETINKLFAAIGEIRGSNHYKLAFVEGKYFWNLVNPQIELLNDSARFTTKASVKVGNMEYEDEVVGKVAINYNEKTNQISVKVLDAVFELYTMVLGKKIHLKNIQIADYLTTPFLFEGPMTMNSEMSFTMPDSTIRTIIAKPMNCKLKILNKQITVSSELDISNKPLLIKKETLNSKK